jgi:ADP-ribosylglycohydrolase
MLGYGRYDQPEGTWSDDTALSLCTMESLCNGYNIENMGTLFCKWLFESHWTPTGFVFDAGLTTFLALDNIQNAKISALKSGGTTADDNGNGSLMRMLPAAVYFYRLPVPEFLATIHDISGITHAHPRAKMGCGIYSLIIRELLFNPDLQSAYKNAVKSALGYYTPIKEFSDELPQFMRIFSYQLPSLSQDEIKSSGYIVDTLEAALWCALSYTSTKDILLAAVNLGLDTDTTGMVAGSIAGIIHGLSSVPDQWLDSLARKREIDDLINRFTDTMLKKHDE